VNAMGTAARVDRISFRRPNFHAKAEAALEELVKAGLGAWQDAATTTKGGRPARAFTLCQHVNMSTNPPGGQPLCQRNPENPRENRGFVDVDTVDAVDSVDAEEVKSPTPTPAVSTVYETPEKPEESEGFVDVDTVDDSPQLYPGGRLFPDQQQLPD
jgi:hypothetical protein